MYEIDHYQVGNGAKSGDAITARFTNPTTGRMNHIVIDGGYQETGETVVSNFKRLYDTDEVDVAFLTHPDEDHIGGMGRVVRELNVGLLVLHDPSKHSGSSLRAAAAVTDLIEVAQEHGTHVVEGWAGNTALDGMITIAGPSESYYEQLVADQVEQERTGARAAAATVVKASALSEALRTVGARFLDVLPIEAPFDDAGGTNPRNNSSMILNLKLDDGSRVLFTGDAGTEALNLALDQLNVLGLNDQAPDLFDIPHHGSRHNLDTNTITRIFGGAGQTEGIRAAIASCTSASKYPSARVVNSLKRRGCSVVTTEEGAKKWGSPDAPPRPDYGPVTPLGPMNEDLEGDD